MRIGQKVRIRQIIDRSSNGVSAKVGQVGTVQAFKMTDGSGIGVVVVFEDKTAHWFFEEELDPLTSGNRTNNLLNGSGTSRSQKNSRRSYHSSY